jgi:hypothetical protein
MNEDILLSRKDVEFLIYLLKSHIKDKNGALEECFREEEKQHWDRFFRVTESKEVLKRVEEIYNNAKIPL